MLNDDLKAMLDDNLNARALFILVVLIPLYLVITYGCEE